MPSVVPTGKGEGARSSRGAVHPFESDLESRIGTRWLGRVGAIALVLATAFFLKHAFDHEWLGPAARVVLGLVVGVSLLAAGEVAHRRRYPWFAQGITATGLGVLYLSIFAAFGFYSLIPQVPAFASMILVTSIGAWLAVRYDAVAVGVLAILGGFLTPPVLSTGEDRQVVLLGYVALLDLGVLLVAVARHWRALNLLAFAGTVLLFTGWAERFYVQDAFSLTFAFLLGFFLFFVAVGMFHNLHHRQRTRPDDLVLLLLNPAVAAIGASLLLEPERHDWSAASALAASLVYLWCGRLAHRRNPDDPFLVRVLVGLSVAFFTGAIAARATAHAITVGWLVEGLVLLVVGFRQQSPATRTAALGVLALAMLRVLVLDGDVDRSSYVVVFNARVASYLLASVVSGACAWLYRSQRRAVGEAERLAYPILGLAPVALVGILVTLEVWTFGGLHGAEHDRQLGLSVAWTVYAGLLLGIGFLRSLPVVRWIGLGVLGLATAKVFLIDLSELPTVDRIVSFLALGLLLMAISYAYQRLRRSIPEGESP